MNYAVQARRKPLAVSAIQWAGNVTAQEVVIWAGPRDTGTPWVRMNLGGRLVLWDADIANWFILDPGWWLVKGQDGDIQRVPPDRFESEYEVEEP